MDGFGSVVEEEVLNTRKWRGKTLLLYTVGPEVQDIFPTLLDAVLATIYSGKYIFHTGG